MTTRRKMMKALEYGVTTAILIAGVFASGTANATNLSSGPVVDAPDDEPDDNAALCSASDSRSRTGRQYAILRPSTRDPSFCLRFKLGGMADNSIPDCWKVARGEGFGCREIIDAN